MGWVGWDEMLPREARRTRISAALVLHSTQARARARVTHPPPLTADGICAAARCGRRRGVESAKPRI